MPSLILPVLVQVAMTFYLVIRVAQSRVGAVRTDTSLIKRGALDPDAWPDKTRQFSNCYGNQFELPMLFYVVIVLYMVTGGAGLVMPILAWLFVALRLLHMLIHTGSNNIRQRFYVFGAGMAILLMMWVVFTVHYLF